MKCLLAGATGLVGQELFKLLKEEQSIQELTLIGRRPFLTHEKNTTKKFIKEFIVDFENLNSSDKAGDIQSSISSVDTVFCCLGATIKKAKSKANYLKIDHDFVMNLAKFALSKGAKNFLIVSSKGADEHSRIFFNHVKGMIENDLQQLPFCSLKIFRPSLLLGDRKEVRMAEKIAIKLSPLLSKLILQGPLKSYMPIKASLVAQNMLQEAFSDDQEKLKIIENEMMFGDFPRRP